MTQHHLEEDLFITLEKALRMSQEIEDAFTCDYCSDEMSTEFEDLQETLKEAYSTLRQILENKGIFFKDETALQKQHVEYLILMDSQKNK